jgi:hypothetical protein
MPEHEAERELTPEERAEREDEALAKLTKGKQEVAGIPKHISARNLRKMLGVSRGTFNLMVDEGHFGLPLTFREGKNAERHFEVKHVTTWLKGRIRQRDRLFYHAQAEAARLTRGAKL